MRIVPSKIAQELSKVLNNLKINHRMNILVGENCYKTLNRNNIFDTKITIYLDLTKKTKKI